MSNPFSYENKRVVVTGGATGVGAGLLEVLAEQGAAHVTVLDLKEPTGPHTTFLQCDLSDQVAVDRRRRRHRRPGRRAVQQRGRRRHPAAGDGDLGELPRAALAVRGPAPEDARRRRDREHRVDRGRPVADAPRHDQRGPRPRRRLGVDPRVARLARHRHPAVRLLQGAGAGVHDALVAPDAASAGCAPTACARRRSTRRCSRTSARR